MVQEKSSVLSKVLRSSKKLEIEVLPGLFLMNLDDKLCDDDVVILDTTDDKY